MKAGVSRLSSNPLNRLGLWTIDTVSDLGRMILYLPQAFRGCFKKPFRFAEMIRQVQFVGYGSFLVVFFTVIATCMVLGLQGYYVLSKFGAESMLGSAVSLTLIIALISKFAFGSAK